ncbi:hypothetical protein QR680_018856 [Steinernema hermaphroditum]|uniref:Uncharacterized protein n=1 Tax=Steinernema hermaphroditum TaxID=289476 RepID=A0AA39LRN6_9BILA|nr:hypothetical protein QR680_018856 [Steinernema hermaphroditum]
MIMSNWTDKRSLEEKLGSFFSGYNATHDASACLLEEAMNVMLPPDDDDDWDLEEKEESHPEPQVRKNLPAVAVNEVVKEAEETVVEPNNCCHMDTSQSGAPSFCGSFEFLVLLTSYEGCLQHIDPLLRKRIEELVYRGREEKNSDHARFMCKVLNDENLRQRLLQQLSPRARNEFFERLFDHYKHQQ